MGRITTNVGLISGLNIKEIVDQLIDISAIPRDNLKVRSEDLQNQQLAIGGLSAKLLSIQFSMGKLAGNSLYASKKTTSSDSTLLTAAVSNASIAAHSSARPCNIHRSYEGRWHRSPGRLTGDFADSSGVRPAAR